jgi:F-type H+-transporting ATPase subunit b
MNSSFRPGPVRRLLSIALGSVLLISTVTILHAQTVLTKPSATETKEQKQEQAATARADKKQTVLNETDEYRLSPTVVKLGALLGMQPDTAANVFTLFNIVVLLGAVGYGLMKVLPKTFRKRSTDLQKNLVDARTATEEATARLNSVEERLSKLDEQIAGIRSQAEADSARDEERIKASVEDEKQKIVAAAEVEIQNATTLARRAIQKYAAELAIEQAERKLVVTPETDRQLVESFANRLGEGGAN